ncbi:MauE/DoxX family redox-associated membrane protein [Micrococcus sp.]|uniref:MauE/DoxX family redox-associated membrane protein n=1 Tax=Micrococcus sp. TaxID=1271 RepID=UPI002A915A79|nr:MauE/DoxX family redox-associated membrane protein [Micrococcus sp.]MDY6054819.1 MauE/DoxX family redox-associated membrane protein [Micrococcus sp.]
MSALWAVALIMFLSGAAKLRTGEDVQQTFTRLRVPRPWNAPLLARAFPLCELLLAVALVQPFTVLRIVAGVGAVALFSAFLVLVVRVKGDGVSCGCFGQASVAPISGSTVVRNVLFLLLAVLALLEAVVSFGEAGAGIAWLPLTGFGSAVPLWGTLVAVLLAACAFLVGRESVAPSSAEGGPLEAAPSSDAPQPSEDGEPERVPFPDAVVVEGGTYRSLHEVVRSGAVLGLRLSTGCGSCQDVIARLPEFADALGPVRLRVFVPQHVPGQEPALGAIPRELVALDPQGAAATGLGLNVFPSAVLLGTDLLTAGGPVFGSGEVQALLEEVREIMAAEAPVTSVDTTGSGPEASVR